MRKQAPEATLLLSRVHSASEEIGEWLKGEERATSTVKDALDNYFEYVLDFRMTPDVLFTFFCSALQDTRVVLNERFNSGTTTRIRRKLGETLRKRPDVFESRAHSVDEAFQSLKVRWPPALGSRPF